MFEKAPKYVKACEVCGKPMRLDLYRAKKRVKRTCSIPCRGKLSSALETQKRLERMAA